MVPRRAEFFVTGVRMRIEAYPLSPRDSTEFEKGVLNRGVSRLCVIMDAHLPERVMKAASWLYANDITAARAMLAEAERKENDIIRASATREIALLKRTVQSGQVKSGSYSVQMPAGNLSVELYKSFWF
jgi:hypothetical protein